MKRAIGTLGVAVLVGAGCGGEPKEGAGEGASGGTKSGNPLTAPVDYLGAVGQAQRQAAQVVDLSNLQHAIRTFEAGEGRRPGRLEELVEEGYLPRLPAAPAGQRFQYDPRTGSVGLVAQGGTP
ncbi:MAG: hypothetical protein KF833_16740 [Verrucomicrobiae bacterium]|nr:hypothetical protein [Verrucomicrobiae bacterium]